MNVRDGSDGMAPLEDAAVPGVDRATHPRRGREGKTGRRAATAPGHGSNVDAAATVADARTHKVVDLDRYVPGFLTWIANKLSRGASQHYLGVFDVGIETWRCLVLLAIEGSISAQQVSRIIGMDKGSVSRCFKSMQARGLVTIGLDAADGRLRIATLTPPGRELHDRILGIALERERAFLAVLSEAERETLIDLLKRLHENLPAVETATVGYVAERFPQAKAADRRRVRAPGGEDKENDDE